MSDVKLNCPHCDQSLEAPEELLGQTVPCPTCLRAIKIEKRVPSPAVPVAAPPAAASPATKDCPFCGERILAVAKKCKHCGEFLDEKNASVARTAQSPKIELSDLPPYYQQEFKRILESEERYKGKWNWAAFLFGPLWAMTKELWLSVAVCFVAGLVTAGIGWIVYWFVYGLRGNYLYYTLHVKKKQLWGGGGSSPPPAPAPTPMQRAAVVGAPVAARKRESAASASGMQTLGKSIGRWYWKGIGRQPVAIQALVGVAILGILGGVGALMKPKQPEGKLFIGPTEAALIANYGPPEKVDSTERDVPRPPMVTRFLIYEPENVRAVYIPEAGIGAPPPYKKWIFVGFQDSRDDHVLNRAEAEERLRRRKR